MDPVTQGLLGAAVGQAVYGPRLGRKAAVFGGLVGMAPDLDIFLNATGTLGEFLWHRGPTHALWFGPLVGPLVGWLLWRWRGSDTERLSDWIGLSILALLTHPLLDLFTSYGTQLLVPFSRHRFSLDAVSIIDPLYSVVLMVPLLVGRRIGWTRVGTQRVAVAALVVTTAYLGFGMALDARAKRMARDGVLAQGMTPVRVESHPTMFQPWLRRLVVRTETGWGIGWASLWTGEIAQFQFFDEPRDPRVERVLATREGQVFTWFADGEVTARVTETGEGATVDLVDLRFGLPGDPRSGIFGLDVGLDREGKPTGVVRRTRHVPSGAGQGAGLLSELYRATFVHGGLTRRTDEDPTIVFVPAGHSKEGN